MLTRSGRPHAAACFFVAWAWIAIAETRSGNELKAAHGSGRELQQEATSSSESPAPVWLRLGGTVDRTSSASERSIEMMQGLTYLASIVNTTRPFTTSDGRPILLDLVIEDDGGDLSKVSEVYEQMLDPSTSTVDAVIGPAPDAAVNAVVQVAEARKAKGGGGPLLILQQVLEVIPQTVDAVSVSVYAPNLLINSLEKVYGQGARKAFFAWQDTNWGRTVCSGAMSAATALGFTTLDGYELDSSDYTPGIQAALEANPDVFVGCGDDGASIGMVINLLALDVNLAGLLLTHSITPGFHQAIGSTRANYIVGPVIWSQEFEPERSCRVFGTPMAFATGYQNVYDTPPTEHAAQVVAAAYAVLLAAEKNSIDASGPISQAALKNSLLQLDEENTFYTRLHFNSQGFLSEKVANTKQIQPLPSNMPQKLRYTESLFSAVGVNGSMLWPAPTWTFKELEIYPCVPGYELNISDLYGASCTPCQVGTQRPISSVSCRPCGVGFYSDVEGLPECKVCPAGADCFLGQTTGIPPAQAGYYRLGTGTYRYESCEPQKICLPSNVCLGQNTGILCAHCETGYTNKGVFAEEENVCTECPPPSVNFLLMSIGVVINIAHMALAAWLTHTAATRVSELHAVVFKMFMEYAHLMTITLMGFEVTFLNPTVYHSVMQSPKSLLQSVRCLFDDVIEVRASAVYAGWGLLPAVLAFNFLVFVLIYAGALAWFKRKYRSVTRRKLREEVPLKKRQGAAAAHGGSGAGGGVAAHPSKRHEDDRARRASVLSQDISTATPPEDASSLSAHDDVHPMHSADDGAAAMPSADTHTDSQSSSEFEGTSANGSSSSDSELEELPDMRVQWRRTQYMINHFVCWNTVWVYLLYPVEVSMLLEPLRCVELDQLRLEVSLDVICTSAEHLPWIIAAVTGMVLYGAGLPIGVFILLFKFRYKLDHVGVRRSLGFLFNGFKRNRYYYEVVHMVRKGALLIAAAAPVMFVRTSSMLFVMVAFLAMDVQLQPYDDRDFGILLKLEELSSLCVISTILTRLFHILRKDIGNSVFASTANSWAVDIGITGACLLLHFSFLSLVAWCMFRDFFLKPGSYKAMLMPRRMTFSERLLQKLERNANRISYDASKQYFNLQKLSPKELEFFVKSLCDTMDCYTQTMNHIHPGFVVSALREAIALCIRDRRRRALELSDTLATKKKVKKWRILRSLEKNAERLNNWWRSLEGDSAAVEEEEREKQLKAETHSRVEKTNQEVRELRKMKQYREDAMAAACTSTATTEELHNALMLCWPDIAEHRRRFYTMDKVDRSMSGKNRKDQDGGPQNGQTDLDDPGALLGDDDFLKEANPLAGAQELLNKHAKLEAQAQELREEVEELLDRVTTAEDSLVVQRQTTRKIGGLEIETHMSESEREPPAPRYKSEFESHTFHSTRSVANTSGRVLSRHSTPRHPSEKQGGAVFSPNSTRSLSAIAAASRASPSMATSGKLGASASVKDRSQFVEKSQTTSRSARARRRRLEARRRVEKSEFEIDGLNDGLAQFLGLEPASPSHQR